MSEPTVHSFPASRAFEWLSAGWRSFKAAPQTWLIATAVAIGISVLFGFVPKLGQLLANFASLLSRQMGSPCNLTRHSKTDALSAVELTRWASCLRESDCAGGVLYSLSTTE